MKRPTMRDIAREAGVSAMTVSLAMRHHPSLSEETSQRVRETARRLGYRTSPLVSAFITEIRHRKEMKSPPSIGYISMYKQSRSWLPTSPFHFAHFQGAQQRSRELGFGFELVEPKASGLTGKRLTEVLLYNNFCGLVIGTMPTTGMVLDLDWERFSVVALGHTMLEPLIHCVEVNHFQAIETAFQRLTELGYRRIALATFQQSSKRIGNRYLAGAEIFRRKVPASQHLPLLISSHAGMNAEKLRLWIERYRPDALIDAGQRKYHQLLMDAGFEIPRDIGYATSNRVPEQTGIAGINQHPFEVGAAAVDTVVKQIYANQKGIPANRSITLIDASWVDGETAPPVGL